LFSHCTSYRRFRFVPTGILRRSFRDRPDGLLPAHRLNPPLVDFLAFPLGNWNPFFSGASYFQCPRFSAGGTTAVCVRSIFPPLFCLVYHLGASMCMVCGCRSRFETSAQKSELKPAQHFMSSYVLAIGLHKPKLCFLFNFCARPVRTAFAVLFWPTLPVPLSSNLQVFCAVIDLSTKRCLTYDLDDFTHSAMQFSLSFRAHFCAVFPVLFQLIRATLPNQL